MTELDRIKEISKKQGLSLQTVAEKAGMGLNSIYRWKTQTPKLDKLEDVAKVLNVPVSSLLDDQTKAVDLNDDDVIMTFDGKPIPDEDKELIKRLLRGK